MSKQRHTWSNCSCATLSFVPWPSDQLDSGFAYEIPSLASLSVNSLAGVKYLWRLRVPRALALALASPVRLTRAVCEPTKDDSLFLAFLSYCPCLRPISTSPLSSPLPCVQQESIPLLTNILFLLFLIFLPTLAMHLGWNSTSMLSRKRTVHTPRSGRLCQTSTILICQR